MNLDKYYKHDEWATYKWYQKVISVLLDRHWDIYWVLIPRQRFQKEWLLELRVILVNDAGAPPVGTPFMLGHDYRYGAVHDGCVFCWPLKQCKSYQWGRPRKHGPKSGWNTNIHRTKRSFRDISTSVLWFYLKMQNLEWKMIKYLKFINDYKL